MPKFTIAFAVTAAFFLHASARAEPVRLTIEDALMRAVEANREIAIAKHRLREFEGLRLEALSSGLPQVTGAGNYNRIWREQQIDINGAVFLLGKHNNYVGSLAVSQLIWDGGKVFKAYKGAKAELKSGVENVKDVELAVETEVRQVFYNVLYVDKVIEVLQRQKKELLAHLAMLRARFDQGLESDYAVMRQEVEVSNVLPQVIDAEKTREFLMNGLKILLAYEPEREIVLDGRLEYSSKRVAALDDIVRRSVAGRHDLISQKQHLEALNQRMGVEKAGYFPTLNFSTAAQWLAQTNSFMPADYEDRVAVNSAVGLSWPIFDGLKTHARIQQAKAQFNQQRERVSTLQDSVVKEVKDAYLALEKAEKEFRSQQKSLLLARRATAIARERFAAGLMSQLEYNDTINAQAKAEQLYYQAIFDCIASEAELARAAGGDL